MCFSPCVAAGRSIFTTMTMYDSRSRARPPCPRYAQSPQREPIVTGVRRAEGFRLWLHGVDRCGQHIHHSSEEDSQVVNLHAGEPRIRQLVRQRNGIGGTAGRKLRASVFRSNSASRAFMSRSASRRPKRFMAAASRSCSVIFCLRRSNLLPGLRTLLGWVVLR